MPEDMNAPPDEWSPEWLEEQAKAVETFRVGSLLCGPDSDGADVAAEQHYLMALSFLEQAERSLKLSAICESRALAAKRGYR